MLASFEHQPGRIPAYPQHKRKYNTDRKHKDTVKCCCWHHFPAKYISCHTSTYKEIHHRQEAQRHSQVLLLLLLASFPTKHFSCHTSIKKELPHRQEGQRHSQVLLLASFEHQPGRIPAYPQHKRKYNTDRKHKDTGKCCCCWHLFQPNIFPATPQHKRNYHTDSKDKDTAKC